MLIGGHFRHEGAVLPVGSLLAGAGAISLGATLGGHGLTADPAHQGERWRFNRVPGAPFLVKPGLAVRAGFHAAVVRDEGLPAPAGHDPVFRDLLGVPGATPGIDRGARGVEAPAVADDQGLFLVFDAAADQGIHEDRLAVSREVKGSLKTDSIKIWPIIRNCAPVLCAAPFHS